MVQLQDIANLFALPDTYEKPEALDYALETMPLDQLYQNAEEQAAKDSTWGHEDHLVMALLAWFKQWFVWVNSAACEKCGCADTQGQAPATPTEEERKYGASVVEIYLCPSCSHRTRFPRYNDPVKLLETHRGRCGEWANAMTLLLRALGLDVRYIWNSEDHVWNEIYSHKQQRWVHVDSCEQAFDKPLTYTDGWGKKMTYVIGFSTKGAKDVSRRYIRRPEMQLPRDTTLETQLQVALASATADRRQHMLPEEQVQWYESDQLEDAELQSYQQVQSSTEGPRQSGSAAWVHSRGEDGPS